MIIAYTDTANNRQEIGKVENEYFSTRISEYSRIQDKYRTYVSYLLLKELAKKIGFDLDNIQIIRDENGKPHAKNNEFYFNIAHSGNIVVVAIDDEEIGVDIEYKRPFDLRIAEKFFSDQIETISNSPQSDIEFTKQWTIFEASLKYYGSIELLRKNVKPNVVSTNLCDNAIKYILTVATKKKIVENEMKIEKI